MAWIERGFNGTALLRSWFDSNKSTLSILVKNGQVKKAEIPQVDLEIKKYLETGEMPNSTIAQYHVGKLRAMGDS